MAPHQPFCRGLRPRLLRPYELVLPPVLVMLVLVLVLVLVLLLIPLLLLLRLLLRSGVLQHLRRSRCDDRQSDESVRR